MPDSTFLPSDKDTNANTNAFHTPFSLRTQENDRKTILCIKIVIFQIIKNRKSYRHDLQSQIEIDKSRKASGQIKKLTKEWQTADNLQWYTDSQNVKSIVAVDHMCGGCGGGEKLAQCKVGGAEI